MIFFNLLYLFVILEHKISRLRPTEPRKPTRTARFLEVPVLRTRGPLFLRFEVSRGSRRLGGFELLTTVGTDPGTLLMCSLDVVFDGVFWWVWFSHARVVSP